MTDRLPPPARFLGAALLTAMTLLATACASARDAPTARATAEGATPVTPRAPARYRVPRHAVHVSTPAQLRAALARRGRRSIVLAAGRYGGAQPFRNAAGHRIYAARVGTAVLEAGMSIGGENGRGGALLRGLRFDITRPGATLDGAAIDIWGAGTSTTVLDTQIRGHGTLHAGVVARRPEGLAIRRIVVRDVTDYGILIDANEPGSGVLRPGFELSDADVSGVARPEPGSSNGTAEACVWIGNTGTVRRVRARSCASAGLWTGTAALHGVFDAVDVDRAPTGVYLEHFTHGSTFRRLRIGSGVRVGMLAEWADPAWDGQPASVDNVIEDSHFASALVGVYLDEGTTRTTVRRSTFAGQAWGAIGDYRGDGNVFEANDYRGLGPGIEAVRHDHLSSTPGPEG